MYLVGNNGVAKPAITTIYEHYVVKTTLLNITFMVLLTEVNK